MTVQKQDTSLAAVFAYHDGTKHHFHRSARSPGHLDWANQPNPFRRYPGAPTYLLPFAQDDITPAYESLYRETAPCRELTVQSISIFLENALAVSASKRYQGGGWKLRCNPSSGNLHPTEGYVVLPALDGLSGDPAVYHYAPNEHALEQRCTFPDEIWQTLTADFPEGAFLAALTSIHWREAWKYGERAYRYCHHDVGHALAAYAYSAAALGWSCTTIDALADESIGAILGLDRTEDYASSEPEHPDLIAVVYPARTDLGASVSISDPAIQGISGGHWRGTANRLSAEHVEWEIIDRVTRVCIKAATSARTTTPAEPDANESTQGHDCVASAHEVFQQRRSAVAMDGVSSISSQALYTMLERTLPKPGRPPWETEPGDTYIHLGLFVHRVDGLPPGLYFFPRDLRARARLQDAMDKKFAWERPGGCPDRLPLFMLAAGDYRRTTAQLSCLQEIAGNGAFSLGMIADFEAPITRDGPWRYPRLFWEAGRVGQALYLDAEAAGLRSTGIGCYFDDPVHELLGLSGRAFQSLYHFTVGGAVEDARLTTDPPYSPERRAASGWL